MGGSTKRNKKARSRARQKARPNDLGSSSSSVVSASSSPGGEIPYEPPRNIEWFSFDRTGVGMGMAIPNGIFPDDVDANVDAHTGDQQRKGVRNDDDDDDDESFVMMEEVQKEVDFTFNYEEESTDDEDSSTDDDSRTTTQPDTDTMMGEDGDMNTPLGIDWDDNQHRFSRITVHEIACFRIMVLLDSVGAPRYLYNKLMRLLKKLTKKGGFNLKKAVTRETLMHRLGTCKTVPRIEAGIVSDQEIFRFNFVDMLQDLLHGCQDNLHIILPVNHSEEGDVPIPPVTEHELWNTAWMEKTFQMEKYRDFDKEKHIMLPMNIYMDKTGTDVNQRYPLEPIIFTLAAIPRADREKRECWRPVGFVPQRKITGLEDDAASPTIETYHTMVSFLLEGIRSAQDNPPEVSVKLPNGQVVRRIAYVPLMIVMGDQLSQDTLCGRIKSNSGGAGRVHRSCMCSYLHVDDPHHQCQKIDMDTINFLFKEGSKTNDMLKEEIQTNMAGDNFSPQEKKTTLTYLTKKRNMFRCILRHPFSMHPIRNAFDGIDFGSWSAGIHDATFDDFMHSVEAGMIAYITETVYGGLTKGENQDIEDLTRLIFDKHKCSVSDDYPRMRLQPGFSNQTLMTSGERVGSLLALSLSLQHPVIRERIRQGHKRQIQKYVDDIPTDTPALEQSDSKKKRKTDTNEKSSEEDHKEKKFPEFYLKQHMHTLDDEAVDHTLQQMIRHGFDTEMMDSLDTFQINQLLWHASEIFKNTNYPDSYPSTSIARTGTSEEGNIYTELDDDDAYPDPARLKQGQVALKERKMNELKALLSSNRLLPVAGATSKHFLKKPVKKGEGPSAAVLTTNMSTLVIFLEYVLCFHAFCKYGWSLPHFLQKHHRNIRAGNRYVVEYFQKLIYRGNATIDSRFPKIHSQCRMALNTIEMNTVMHFCCETGERLLKTEAKGISKTAQQRSGKTFVAQTMSRLQDRCLMDSFSLFLDEQERKHPVRNVGDECAASQGAVDRTARKFPHFIYLVEDDTLTAHDRFQNPKKPDKESGTIDPSILCELKKKHPQTKRFEIFNEVVLRNNCHVRASPNYAKMGAWYDYAIVAWENDDGSTSLIPAKCICFFRNKDCDGDNEDDELKALVHAVDEKTEGKVPGRFSTLLTTSFQMEFEVERSGRKKPKTHVVSVASIDSPICCYPIAPNENALDPESLGITYVLPRNHWSYMWMAINQCLAESNTPRKISKRKGYNPLSDSKWLKEVRETYQRYMEATSLVELTKPVRSTRKRNN